MITLQKEFGASDHPECPSCGQPMSVVRRSPHTFTPGFEAQTLRCMSCAHESLRSVDAAGNVQRADESTTGAEAE